jgi:cell division GTPase FtsZ
MRLLSIGLGKKGSRISELLAKKGKKINNVSLFKCYSLHHELSYLKRLKLPETNKFHVWLDYEDRDSARSILNTIFSKYEFFEAFLLITHIEDDYGFELAKKLGDELLEMSEDPVIVLVILPLLDSGINFEEIRRRLKILANYSHFLLLFEERDNMDWMILNSMNLISLAGEIDLKKRLSGEVVVDTSDVFNSFFKGGLSTVGVSSVSISKSWLKKIMFWKEDEVIGEKSRRMVEMVREAIEKNLSARCDLNTAKSALLLFGGDPEDITMDGMFSCLNMLEKMFPRLKMRYGDYPVPKSSTLTVVVLFSGMTGFKF